MSLLMKVMKMKDSQRNCTASKRPKGPPIICLLCKKVWDKNLKGGRFFMFGGSRPFMAKFEAKMKALVGRDDLESMKIESATKFGRSYICRECYMIVKQAYDSIRTLQRNVAKSVERKSQKANNKYNLKATADPENDISDSDQDLEIENKEVNSSRRNLPPVLERVAQKIANLKYVAINHKVATLQLHRISKDTEFNLTRKTSSSMMSKSELENKETLQLADESSHRINQTETDERNAGNYFENYYENESFGCELQRTSNQNANFSSSSQDPIQYEPNKRSNSGESIAEDEISLLSIEEKKLISLQTGIGDVDNSLPTEYRKEKVGDRKQNLENILSNPLLLVKFPQPIQLADVKNENVYICTQRGCDWIFSSKFFWENHIRHFHCSGKPYQCPFENCRRSFTGKSKLELHVRSHTDERPFICDKCGHGFRGNQELKAHKLTHTNEKAYQCPKCDKSFKLLSSMKRHLQFHDGNLPYHCNFHGCSKSFKSRYDLKCHYRIHTGEKPYKCKEPGCGMAFRIPCQFTMHKRAHTGERPFECTASGCNMAYASSNTLQAHMLTHTTERPYCCEFCGKTLKHKLMYKAHLKKHEGSQDFVSFDEKRNDKNIPISTSCINNIEQVDFSEHNSESMQRQKELQTYQDRIISNQNASSKLTTEGETFDHSKEKMMKLLCPFDPCGIEHEDAVALEDHLRTEHTPALKVDLCHLCDLACSTADKLKDHTHSCSKQAKQINEEKKEKSLPCSFDQCLEHFKSRFQLFKHSKVHFGFFKCPFDGCNKSTKTLKTVHTHLQMHEKPFECSLCYKRFATSSLWLKHKRSHSDTPANKCAQTDSGGVFTDSFPLLEHQNSHSNVTNLCPECGEVYVVTTTKHECGANVQTSVNEVHVPTEQTPFLQQHLPQQSLLNEQHHQALQHRHQTPQALDTHFPHQHGALPQQQLHQNQISISPESFTPHSVLQTQRLITPSLLVGPPSTSTMQSSPGHLMLHLQRPSTSSLPSHSRAYSSNVGTGLHSGESQKFHLLPSQSLPIPSHLQPQNNSIREKDIPAQTQDTQPYTMEQARPNRGENSGITSLVAGRETATENQPFYNYVILYNNPPQQ